MGAQTGGIPRIEQNLSTWLGNVSYVTGAHSFKAGLQSHVGRVGYQRGRQRQTSATGSINGVPNLIYQRATPYFDGGYVMTAELGLFAQDRWTVNRMTVNYGVRFDYLSGYFAENHLGPAKWLPNRNVTFPRTDRGQLEGHLTATGCRVRPVRGRQDGAQG